MGMDVYGHEQGYFRATIWQWRALCSVMIRAGWDVPEVWFHNNGEGLDTQEECDHLVECLRRFLDRDESEVFILESQSIRIMEDGRVVDPSTPGAISPFRIRREQVQEFIDFLLECGGFAIH